MVVNVNKVEPEKVFVPSTTHSPNSELPVLAYRNALTDKTLEGSLAAVEPTGWIKGGHWKIAGVVDAATPHFHSTTHECYTVLRGRGTYLLGKSPLDPDVDENGQSVGVSFTASAGDIFAFPAGVTHYVTATEDEYEIIGYFALSGQNSREAPYDMEFARGTKEETERMREKCKLVGSPENDPVHGPEGPMTRLWKR